MFVLVCLSCPLNIVSLSLLVIKLPEFKSVRQRLGDEQILLVFSVHSSLFSLFSSSLYFNMSERTPLAVTGKVHKD